MPGTRIPQKHAVPLEAYHVQNHYTVHAGYPPYGNSHSGVCFAFNMKKNKMEDLHSYAYPSHRLAAGRALAVRQRARDGDLLHVGVYFPPYTAKGAHRITSELLKWLRKLFTKLPI
eukprot:5051055-Karenia_brevis.AAC.1